MPDLTVISLGAGVQSTTLLLMAVQGDLPKPDAAVFADTQAEPEAVYKQLDWVRAEAEDAGIPVYIVTAGNLWEDTLDTSKRSASIPVFLDDGSGNAGILSRQCTQDYKIQVIRNQIAELMGGKRSKVAELWMGISLDEVQRMRDSNVQYIRNRYPLIEQRMSRADCVNWLQRHEYPEVASSSCVFCPYHSNRFWRRMRDETPQEFQRAIEFDRQIRQLRNVRGTAYLHRSLQPLEQVDLSTPEDHGQLTMFDSECEGMCGV